MSKEAARQFIEAAQCDENLRAKVKAHIDDDKIHSVAKEHGYDFSHEEMHSAMKEKWNNKEDPNFCFICI